MNMMKKQTLLNDLKNNVLQCKKCSICTCNQVFSCGNPNSSVMFIGEAPGKDEVKELKPFVGQAGKLLTNYFEETLINRNDDLYITNVVKCRPTYKDNPNKNKKPDKDEIKNCLPFLIKEINIIKPKLIVLCGGTSYGALMNKKSFKISEIRGKIFKINIDSTEYDAITIYHPSYLMQYANQIQIDKTKDDLKLIRTYLDLK